MKSKVYFSRTISPDKELDIPNGKIIQKNYVGKNIDNYDSMLVLSHFKGHPMGGYGGAIKQLSIGVASSYGKAYIHGAGEPEKSGRQIMIYSYALWQMRQAV